jgi:hypothetical protein
MVDFEQDFGQSERRRAAQRTIQRGEDEELVA